MPKRATSGFPPVLHAGVSELRALAHPLRIRILEVFAEQPRTTMQVAAVLGQPPTRLYHHVNALEKAGLLRVKETRANRGTTEKYYEPAALGFAGTGADRSPRSRAARTALATAALDQSKVEVAAALSSNLRTKPLVARVGVVGKPARIEVVRKRIGALMRDLRKMRDKGPATVDADDERWTLTITFAPALGRSRT